MYVHLLTLGLLANFRKPTEVKFKKELYPLPKNRIPWNIPVISILHITQV